MFVAARGRARKDERMREREKAKSAVRRSRTFGRKAARIRCARCTRTWVLATRSYIGLPAEFRCVRCRDLSKSRQHTDSAHGL